MKKKCPCEGCLKYAICYHQEEVNCNDLYKYLEVSLLWEEDLPNTIIVGKEER